MSFTPVTPLPNPGANAGAGAAFGGFAGTLPPSSFTPADPTPATGTGSAATAQSAHTMLKAVMLELGFVVVATMLAGISDTWGSGMLTLMLALLVLRGLFEVDIFAAFAQGTVLRPK